MNTRISPMGAWSVAAGYWSCSLLVGVLFDMRAHRQKQRQIQA